MSDNTLTATDDPSVIIAEGLADLALLKQEVADADYAVDQATSAADEALARLKEETDVAVNSAKDDADAVRARYADRITELVGTGWATIGGLESQGHVARRRPARKGSK